MSSSSSGGRGGGWFSGWFGGGQSSSPRPEPPKMDPPPQPPKRNDQWAGPNPTASQVRQAQHQRWMLGKGDHPDVIAQRAQKASQPPPEPKGYTGFDFRFPGFGFSFPAPTGGKVDTRFATAQATAKASPQGVEVGFGVNAKESTYTHPNGSTVGTSVGVGGGFAIKEDGPTKTRVEASVGKFSGGHSFDNQTVEDFVDFNMNPSKPGFWL